jgi:hypothetical protein
MKKILIVATPETNNILSAWCENNPDADFSWAGSDERAIEMTHIEAFDIIIADSTNAEIDIKKLQAILPILQDDTDLVVFSGEDIEKLDEKISMIFKRKMEERKQRIFVLDSTPGDIWSGLPGFSVN